MQTRPPAVVTGPRRRGRRPPPNYALRRAVALVVAVAVLVLVQAAARTVIGWTSAERDHEPVVSRAQDRPAPGAAQRHRLRVLSRPSGARLSIRSGDEVVAAGTTPYAGRVPGGDVVVTLELAGHNVLRQPLELKGSRTLRLWLDPRGLLHHKLVEFRTGSLPKQVAFSPNGDEIWVTPLGESGIEVYDAATGKRRAEIDTGEHGTVEVIFTADGDTVYASQMQTASVFEIDRKSFRIRRTITTGSEWSKVMVLSPDEKRLYVANWSGDNVTEIDLKRGRARRQLPTVDTPRGLYVTPDGKRLFVAGYERGELQRIDLASGRSRIVLQTGGALRHLVGDVAGDFLYADDMATDEVFVVDLATEEARKLAATDHSPNTMDLTADGKVLYVSNRGENNPTSYSLPGPEWGTVLAIDTASGGLLDAIVAGNQTTGLDVSSDGRLLAFSDFLDNRVSVYRIPAFEVLADGDGGRSDERLKDLEKSQ